MAVQEQMIARITFGSAQPFWMRSARLGPMPATSRKRSGLSSRVSNTASPKAWTSLLA
jgi:hypothetical protein